MAGLLSLGAFNGNNISPWTPTKGLLGLGGFGGSQPPAGLLGPYYSPDEERRRKISGAMTQAGIQLLTNGRGSFGEVLGQGLAGAVQGANNAGINYREDALGYHQLEQQMENQKYTRDRQVKEDAWTNTERQYTLEQRQQADEEKQARKASVMEWAHQRETKQPGFLKWASDFPEEAAKLYSSEMMPEQSEFRPATPEEKTRYGVTPETPLVIGKDGKPTILSDGKSTVNVNPPLPAEIGARIGLGERFLSTDYPDTIDKIQSGNATGPIDYLTGKFGRGDAGEVQRRMATGVDSLRRNLTGAGMGVSEAGEYANRYLPQWFDDADTLERKALGLKADLEAVSQGALRGKAGTLGELLQGQQGWGTTIDQGMTNQTPPLQNGPKVIDGYSIRRVQ